MSKTTNKYSPEVRERAVRMVFSQEAEHESQWAAICSISTKLGMTSETLRRWVRQAEIDQGQRAGTTSAPSRSCPSTPEPVRGADAPSRG